MGRDETDEVLRSMTRSLVQTADDGQRMLQIQNKVKTGSVEQRMTRHDRHHRYRTAMVQTVGGARRKKMEVVSRLYERRHEALPPRDSPVFA